MKNEISFINGLYIENGKVVYTNDPISLESEKLIYEVLRVDEGIPVFFEEHIKRMKSSYEMIDGKGGMIEEFREDVEKLIKESGISEGNVQLLLAGSEAERYAYFIKHSYPTEEQYDSGVNLMFYSKEREMPKAKILNMSFKQEVKRFLVKKEAYEAVLIDRDGVITEGSRSNLFFVKGDEVVTPDSGKILQGITRMKILSVAKENGISIREGKVRKEELAGFDGVFMSGTSPEVLAVNKIDSLVFESSENEVIRELHRLYREECSRDKEKYVKKYR